MASEERGAADRRPADAASVLAVLADHEVDFLIVGGMAVQAHGYLRSTFDVDILPRPDGANLGRLSEALRALDARILTEDGSHAAIPGAVETLSIGDLFLTTKFGALDLVNGPRPDIKRYDRLASGAVSADLGRFSVLVLGKDDLIAMKLAAGRDKDLADVNALTEAERG